MNNQLNDYLQTVTQERHDHGVKINVLNAPVFEVDLVQPPKQKFWLHQMEVSEHADANTTIRGVILTGIVFAIITVLWVYSNELQAFFN